MLKIQKFRKIFPEDDRPLLREIVDIDKRYCLFIVKMRLNKYFR